MSEYRTKPSSDRCSSNRLFGQRLLDLESSISNIPKPTARIFLQTSPEERADDRRCRVRNARPINFVFDHAPENVHRGFAGECRLSREHLEQDNAEHPDVGPRIGDFAFRLLGSHVGRCAENHADAGGSGVDRRGLRVVDRLHWRDHLGESEVRTFTRPFVLMFAGFRSRWMIPRSCAASSASAICLAIANASATGIGPLAITSAGSGHHELHHQSGDVARPLQTVNGCDIGMIERGKDFRLTLKS